MTTDEKGSFGPLGSETPYDATYNPGLLFPINRRLNREKFLDQKPLVVSAMQGVDQWTAYEASWLGCKGKPEVALLDIRIPANSPCTVESKSLKLYLNSLNQATFDSVQEYIACVRQDLEQLCQSTITIKAYDVICPAVSVSAMRPSSPGEKTAGFNCIDSLDIAPDGFHLSPEFLKAEGSSTREKLCSHLFRSNCPVTNQPDWASIFIEYRGPQISHEGLLAYICSYRQHQGFHEDCIEQMFVDLMTHCHCEQLAIEGRFLRRGGIDINPFRSTEKRHGFGIVLNRQ